MADHQKLIRWLYDQRSTLDFSIDQFEWPSQWDLDWYDYGVRFSVDGHTCHGQGTDFDEATAISKAIGEALERYIFRYHGFPTTNGFAVHIDSAKAKANAIAESIERDAYLCHHLTGTPFLPLAVDGLGLGDLDKIKARLHRFGYALTFWQLCSASKSHYVTMCTIKPECAASAGARLGLGCALSISASASAALNETLRNIAGVLDKGEVAPCTPLSDFLRLQSPGPVDHMQLCNHIDGQSYLAKTLKTEATQTKQSRKAFKHVLKRIDLPPIIKSAPLFAYRATCSGLQDLYFGIPTTEVLNMARLNEFAGRNLTQVDLEHFPHLLA